MRSTKVKLNAIKKIRVSSFAVMEWFNSKVDLRAPGKYHLVLWKYLGIIPPKDPGYKRRAYIWLSIIIHTLFTLGCPLSMVINTMKAETFGKFSENMYYAVAFVVASGKFACTLFILPKLNSISEVANRLHRRTTSYDELMCLQERMDQGHLVFKRISVLFTGQVLITIVASLVYIIVAEPSLIVPAWLPLDWENNQLHFYLCFFYQILCLIIFLSMVFASDTFFLLYTEYLIGHINALSVRIQKIGKESKSSQDNFTELIQCIKDHQHILRQVLKIHIRLVFD